MASRIPWRFLDPETLDEYSLPVNPHSDNGSFSVKANVVYSVTGGVSATSISNTLVYSNGYEAEAFSFSGNLYEKDDLDSFFSWFSKSYPFQIRDDLGKEYLVMIETFEINRVRARHYRWKHSYTFTGFVLEEIT